MVPILAVGVMAAPFWQPAASAAAVSDNFNRANGGLGSNWTTVAGTAAPKIASNTLQPGTAGAVNSAYWSGSTFGADQFAQANLPNSSGTKYGPGIAVRLSNSKGYFLWYGNSANTISIWRMDSATSWTLLKNSGALTISATDVWKIQAVGSTISAYQNGNLVAQVTDTHYTAGSPGVWMYYAANQITNWSGGDVGGAPTYSVGGTVSGLSGTVVLQDNGGDALSVSANGSFGFATQLAGGSAYSVTVQTNPAGQTCTVANGSGTVGSANVTTVAVTCATNVTATYSVGGTVSGLSGTVVLQDNGGDALSVSASGSFAFATQLAGGSAYSVTVQTNPAGQTCTVANGSGTVGSANVTTVAVSCSTNTTTGGSASDDFNRANGPLGSNWTDYGEGGMTIKSQAVAGASSSYSGDIRTAETYSSDQYSAVQITSTQLTGGQWIGPAVRVQNGGQNEYLGLYFWNSGNPELMLFKRTSGTWTQLGSSFYSGALPVNTTLELSVTGKTLTFMQDGVPRIIATDSGLTGGAPGIMAYGTGQVDSWSGGNMVAGPSHTVGGTVSGLNGTVVLLDNGGDSLGVSANGSFTFATPVPAGSAYSVTVQNEPSGQTCSVANGTGTIGSGNVTNVAVLCQKTVSGTGSDDFNRPDGALGSNWTDDSDGGLSISSQVATGADVSGDLGDIRTGEAYSSDQFSQIQTTATQLTGGQWIGVAVRMQDGGQNGYAAVYFWNSGSPELLLFRRDGSSWSQIGSTYNCGPLPAGTTLKLMAVGNTLAVMENGVERIATFDDTYVGGAPGIMAHGAAQVDNWSGGSAGFEVHYLGTDASGVETYDVISANNGYGPQPLRVLRPTNPAVGVAHNFLYTLPVEAGEGTTWGDGLQVVQSLNAQNQYNLTVIEPSFAINPWYADNPTDASEQEETFMTTELQPWVMANLSTTGTEQSWLIGFSKSGIGGQDLLLKHPTLFTLAASWDFPADMSSYDEYGSADSYGTDANFQANYELTPAFVSAHASPFVANNRIWIGSYQVFQTDVSDYDALLTSLGIQHSTETPTQMAHRWDSGWVPIALAALYHDSTNLHS